MLDDLDDDALMTAARAGEVAAFSALLRRHERAVLRYLVRALPDAEEARDVCQDVFVEVWNRRARYEARGLFQAWLFRLARSRATSRGRFLRVRRLFADARGAEARGADDVDNRAAPDAVHEERARAAALRGALDALPATLRDAVALRHGAGLDHRTIASILAVDEATARQRACRGLALLRARLQGAS